MEITFNSLALSPLRIPSLQGFLFVVIQSLKVLDAKQSEFRVHNY